MKTMLAFAASAATLAAAASAAAQQHAAHPPHRVYAPSAIAWGPGPAALPPGAQAAVLYGDPSKPGVFAMRLKLPAGYAIAPHSHPGPEIVTVVSGAFRMGMGTTADRRGGHLLRSGALSAMEPGTPHYAFAEAPTVLQINSVGPWAVNYVDPAHDPRGPRR